MAHQAMSEFNSSEYAPPRCGLEVQEEDGSWRQATVFTHTAHGNVVLWYGPFEHAGGLELGVHNRPPVCGMVLATCAHIPVTASCRLYTEGCSGLCGVWAVCTCVGCVGVGWGGVLCLASPSPETAEIGVGYARPSKAIYACAGSNPYGRKRCRVLL